MERCGKPFSNECRIPSLSKLAIKALLLDLSASPLVLKQQMLALRSRMLGNGQKRRSAFAVSAYALRVFVKATGKRQIHFELAFQTSSVALRSPNFPKCRKSNLCIYCLQSFSWHLFRTCQPGETLSLLTPKYLTCGLRHFREPQKRKGN